MFTIFCGMTGVMFALVFRRRSSSSSWEVPSSDWALKGSEGDNASAGEGESASAGGEPPNCCGGGDVVPKIPRSSLFLE